MNGTKKKLVLHKQTLRQLTPSDLHLVAGGSIAGDPTAATDTGAVCQTNYGCNATALTCTCTTHRYDPSILEC